MLKDLWFGLNTDYISFDAWLAPIIMCLLCVNLNEI